MHTVKPPRAGAPLQRSALPVSDILSDGDVRLGDDITAA